MKNKFKGTRGKWNVELKKDMISIHTGDSSADVEKGKGVWHDPNICGIWAHVDYDDRQTCEANAYLISSAPELLEALQNCLSALISFGANDEWAQVIEAKKAINKALGN
jgi:hypothetical protein